MSDSFLLRNLESGSESTFPSIPPSETSPYVSIDVLLGKYVESLSEKELKAYHIAKSHLGTSFNLEKSRGFLDWKNKIADESTNLVKPISAI